MKITLEDWRLACLAGSAFGLPAAAGTYLSVPGAAIATASIFVASFMLLMASMIVETVINQKRTIAPPCDYAPEDARRERLTLISMRAARNRYSRHLEPAAFRREGAL